MRIVKKNCKQLTIFGMLIFLVHFVHFFLHSVPFVLCVFKCITYVYICSYTRMSRYAVNLTAAGGGHVQHPRAEHVQDRREVLLFKKTFHKT